MVLQNDVLVCWPESFCKSSALFFREYDPAKIGIHGEIIVKHAAIPRSKVRLMGCLDSMPGLLVQHIDRLSKVGPSSTIRAVHVTCRIDIWPTLMQSRVNDETRSVDKFVGTANAIALLIDMNHVGYLQ